MACRCIRLSSLGEELLFMAEEKIMVFDLIDVIVQWQRPMSINLKGKVHSRRTLPICDLCELHLERCPEVCDLMH